jgi:hypothetical protein
MPARAVSCDHVKSLVLMSAQPHFGYLKLAGRLVGNTLIANDSAAACPPDPFHRILILAHLSFDRTN